MSHRKVHSHGSIPFSWEHKPGVSKECQVDRKLEALNLTSSSSSSSSATPPLDLESTTPKSLGDHMKIPLKLPPCQLIQAPRRCTSSKGLAIRWWQEDPFLAAYKECTKSTVRNNVKLCSEADKSSNNGSKTRIKSKRTIFSCKNSCEVRDDNLVLLTNLPPLPKDRSIRSSSRCESK